jgi:hypothetical protein
MYQRIIYTMFIFIFCLNFCFGQENNKDEVKVISKDTLFNDDEIDPLSPARAAFYSTVLPGLGQAYNKKYWKIPIVWAAIGTGVYFYRKNDELLDTYQEAYKLRISGRPDDFDGTGENPNLSTESLVRAQEIYKKNKDLSLFLTIGLYALNIIEANVDAHLDEKAFNQNLSFRPSLYINPIDNQAYAGLNLKIGF